MANSFETFNGDGVTTDFTFTFPYLEQSHVKAYEDLVEDTGITFLSATQVRFPSAPASGTDNVKVGRTTPSGALTDYVDGSTLGEADLDRALLQALYVSEEASDSLGNVMSKNGVNWNGEGVRLTSIGAAVDNDDAATKADVVSLLGSAAGIPAPANPGDDGKALIASAGLFAWTAVGMAVSGLSDASTNAKTFLQAANYGAMRTALGVAIGTDVLAYSANVVFNNISQAWSKLQYFTPITGPATGAAAPDWTNGNVVHSTLTGNLTSIAAPVGVSDGATVVWRIKQDATGGRTAASWNASYKFAGGGTAPTLSTTANAYDVLVIERFGSEYLVSKIQDYQ